MRKRTDFPDVLESYDSAICQSTAAIRTIAVHKRTGFPEILETDDCKIISALAGCHTRSESVSTERHRLLLSLSHKSSHYHCDGCSNSSRLSCQANTAVALNRFALQRLGPPRSFGSISDSESPGRVR